MVKYTKSRGKGRKSLRRTRRKVPKTLRHRRRHRGGFAPIGENGGNFGVPPKDYPVGQSGAIPDPESSFPIKN